MIDQQVKQSLEKKQQEAAGDKKKAAKKASDKLEKENKD